MRPRSKLDSSISSPNWEFAKEFPKVSRHGRDSFVGGQRWVEELGDVAFALCCLASKTGVDLDSALDDALRTHF